MWSESNPTNNIMLLVLTVLWLGLFGPLLVFSYMSSSLSDYILLHLGRATAVANLTVLLIDCVVRIKLLRNHNNNLRTANCVNCTLFVLRFLEFVTIAGNAILFLTLCLQEGTSCMGQDVYLQLIQLTQSFVVVGLIIVLGLFSCATSCLHWNPNNPLIAYSPPPAQPTVQESAIVEIQLAKSTDRRFSASNCAICMEHIQKESREKLNDNNESECKDTQQYKQGNRSDTQVPQDGVQEVVDTSEEQELLHLQCGHLYHSICLVKWIHSGPNGHLNCPLCNKECVLLLNEEGNRNTD